MRHTLVTSRDQARRHILQAHHASKSVGVVMTMGALHAGHLQLVHASTDECDFTAVTIFVNPTQFAAGEDFEQYPRNLASDLEALRDYPVDLIFAPDVAEMYRSQASTSVEPPQVALLWEGQCRPGHFRGVCTIVLKLLQAVPADVAYFGQKDYQQYLVLRDMCADLTLPVRLQLVPTVRDADGLALSSRNQYLNSEERQRAVAISQSLQLAQQLLQNGTVHTGQITSRMRDVLYSAGIEHIDYIAIADPETLTELRSIERRAVAMVAARVGRTRLIDNQLLTMK